MVQPSISNLQLMPGAVALIDAANDKELRSLVADNALGGAIQIAKRFIQDVEKQLGDLSATNIRLKAQQNQECAVFRARVTNVEQDVAKTAASCDQLRADILTGKKIKQELHNKNSLTTETANRFDALEKSLQEQISAKEVEGQQLTQIRNAKEQELKQKEAAHAKELEGIQGRETQLKTVIDKNVERLNAYKLAVEILKNNSKQLLTEAQIKLCQDALGAASAALTNSLPELLKHMDLNSAKQKLLNDQIANINRGEAKLNAELEGLQKKQNAARFEILKSTLTADYQKAVKESSQKERDAFLEKSQRVLAEFATKKYVPTIPENTINERIRNLRLMLLNLNQSLQSSLEECKQMWEQRISSENMIKGIELAFRVLAQNSIQASAASLSNGAASSAATSLYPRPNSSQW